MAIKVGVVLFFVGLLGTLAFGQARTPYTRPAYVTTPGSISTSASGDQFVCTATNAVCEVESSIDATTMTSTVPAFDIGPTATPGANDKLACFSYGATGSKTRVACVDTEGDINGRVFQSTALSAGTGFACTNLGCRLSLGNTSGYLVQDGAGQYSFANAGLSATYFTTNGTYQTNSGASATLNGVVTDGATAVATILRSNGTLATAGAKITSFRNGSSELGFIDYLGNLSANSFVSTTASGSTLTGGGASGALEITSNTTDAATSGTVPAIRLKASQNITDADLLMSVEDSVGNRRLTVTESGNLDVGNDINDVRDVYVTRYFFSNGETIVNGALRRTSSSVTIADNGGGTPATHTQAYLSTVASFVRYTCNDADGCDVTMSETNVEHGHVLMFANTSANNVTFADISGVQEMAGGVTATLGQYDTLQLVYTGDRWAELHRSDN